MQASTPHPAVAPRGIWPLDPSVVYLNHGSFGSCPRPVLEAQAELRERLEAEPVAFMARELLGLLDDVRSALGSFLGANPRDLAPVPNATTAVNAVLFSYPFEPGDELLVTDHGYNACRNAIELAAERAGAKVVVAHLPFPIASPDEVVDAVLGEVTARTRFALLDHVTSPTALVLPVERLVPALAERGIDTMVDGAHAPGMLPLDLDALGACFYTGNAHKWLCAPKGAAFLHVRADRQELVRPVTISHGANAPAGERSKFLLEFDWCGTDDPTAWLSIPKALETIGGLSPEGWPGVLRANRDLALEGRRLLLDALGTPAPAPEEMIGSIATVLLPEDPQAPAPLEHSAFDVDPLQQRLFDEHRIEVPVMHCAATPARLLRISAQVYNNRREYELLADVLRG
ncbi:MAG TPA: aminotransferase class V-fold PLP-dependent enzyme [Planctomycetes bacterium]|nr:aminotransferase class V-fold PLP-dependent enzyme [Planctomycetota bacterium]